MRIGYARVSTQDQNSDLQEDALKKAGCQKIYIDKASGAKTSRPELEKLLSSLRDGDVLVIWKLDRLGRSLKHLIELAADLHTQGVGLVSLSDPVDTTTPQGRLIFNVFASLAEFERDLIKERTNAGLKAARERGRKGGRPKGLNDAAKVKAAAAATLYQRGDLGVMEICAQLGISKPTLYSYLRHEGVK